jgi:hypothetical protein
MLLLLASVVAAEAQESTATPKVAGLSVATFDIDATPPLGSMMAYDPVRRIDELSLRARGIVILGAGEPIVLAAFDWLGIANEAHAEFRRQLAAAAKTRPERVAVHAIHQHDAPWVDFTAERILMSAHRPTGPFQSGFARKTLQRLEAAVQASIATATPIDRVGWGSAEVRDVASNRRILGPDGRVRATRYTATKDPAIRAEPTGLIDPEVSLLSLWNGDKPVAVLSHYACHPQSYYRTGVPSPDFPGIARFIRGQAVPEALHVHFNGAGGNLGAGKFNDGSRENRMALAIRLADGMERAWKGTVTRPIKPADVGWSSRTVHLPLAKVVLDDAPLLVSVRSIDNGVAWRAAEKLAYRDTADTRGRPTELTMLRVGQARMLHLPGELFVEYQLAAKRLRPDLQVAVAAYGDYGAFYIGTAKAYAEGGYETATDSSHVAPEVEPVLMGGIKSLLTDP